MGALEHAKWLWDCVGHAKCDNIVTDNLNLIHARPLWWALIELALVPHWRDPKRHPPWYATYSMHLYELMVSHLIYYDTNDTYYRWVDVLVIFVFMSCWAIHYATFHAITNTYVYGEAWNVGRWLLYYCTTLLYSIVRLLTIIRFRLARRCGRRWPYRYVTSHIYMATIPSLYNTYMLL
jgi:hypothetical protein